MLEDDEVHVIVRGTNTKSAPKVHPKCNTVDICILNGAHEKKLKMSEHDVERA